MYMAHFDFQDLFEELAYGAAQQLLPERAPDRTANKGDYAAAARPTAARRGTPQKRGDATGGARTENRRRDALYNTRNVLAASNSLGELPNGLLHYFALDT